MAKKSKWTGMPRDRAACDDDIKRVGELRQQLTLIEAGMNQELADIKQRVEEEAKPINAELKQLEIGIEVFCRENRELLTEGGKTKTVKFGNGDVSWRLRPAAVSIKKKTNTETVVAWLLEAGGKFKRFLRVEHTLNKEAMLADPALAAEVPDVKISSAGEKFEITPFGAELAAAEEAA